MANKFKINLDINKESYLILRCKQNDDLALEVNLYQHGEKLDISNKTINIKGLKSNNTYIIQSDNISKNDNKITVSLNRDFTRIAGKTKIEITLQENGKQNTTFTFYLDVVKSVIDGAVESSNTVTIIETLDNKIVEAVQVKEETEQLISSGGAATKGDIQQVNSQLEQNKNEIIKKAEKTYVDIQDKELLRLIGQGVTDEQIKVAIQTKISDGSIASIVVGENSVRPINLNNGAKNVQPLIWSITDNSIVKNISSIIVGNRVGILYRKTFVYISEGEYTFDGSDKYLVLRDVLLSVDGGETITPIVVGRTNLTESDIILAYKSNHIWSIWDELISDYTNNKNKNILNTTTQRTPLGVYATITSMFPFNIDTVNNVINLHEDSFINYNNKFIKLSSNIVDITNALKGGFLWYDVTNNKIVDIKPSSGENYIYLGTLWVGPIIVNINNECGFTLNGLPYNYQSARWTGKSINCLGDSITQGVGCTKPYHQWLSQLCGFKTVRNYGVGGSTISRKTGSEPSWDTALPFVDRYLDMDNNADVILVFGGVNDWVAGREMGTLADDVDTTFYGALKILIEGLKIKYPNKEICFITPMQNNYKLRPPHGGNKNGTNTKGKYLIDYVNVIKEVCGIYGVAVKDMYHDCFYGLSENENALYMPDYLHPNDKGHKEKMACKIGNFINSL